MFDTAAFPAGTLKVALLVPAAASTLTARFKPLSAHYNDLRIVLQGASGGMVFVRSGSVRLAGAGPAHIPQQGMIKYRGRKWAVFSWQATPQSGSTS